MDRKPWCMQAEAATPIPISAPRKHSTLQAVVRHGAHSITIGGDSPVRVQSMTNTDTTDAIGTAIQVKELALAGSELVRITVNYRINPGNVGKGDKKDKQFTQTIEAALRWDKPVRIGVNWGSLDQDLLADLMDANNARSAPWSAQQVMYEALITSAIGSANRAAELGMPKEQILLSCKVSGVQDLIAVYRALAQRCNYPLHLGLTEAGMGTKGTVASAAALSVLLQEGIGDTIRVSLTPQPGESRTQEVVVASEILQALGLRAFVPSVTACPGCGRTTSSTFQELAKQIDDFLRTQMPSWRKQYPGVEGLKIAVMGCIVNGPGESKHADIGISLPGTGEAPAAPVFIDGEKALTLRGETIAHDFQALVTDYIHKRFSPAAH